MDVICINAYFGWYSDTGRLDIVSRHMGEDIRAWKDKCDKPVIVSEYGADTVAGFHEQPSTIFTEEFQTGSQFKVFL